MAPPRGRPEREEFSGETRPREELSRFPAARPPPPARTPWHGSWSPWRSAAPATTPLRTEEAAMHRVEDLMNETVICVRADTSVAEAERLAAERGIRHLVVLSEDQRVAGVLCTCDLDEAE